MSLSDASDECARGEWVVSVGAVVCVYDCEWVVCDCAVCICGWIVSVGALCVSVCICVLCASVSGLIVRLRCMYLCASEFVCECQTKELVVKEF